MERELRRWRRWRRLRSCSVRLEEPEFGQVNDPERPWETNSLSSPHMNKCHHDYQSHIFVQPPSMAENKVPQSPAAPPELLK